MSPGRLSPLPSFQCQRTDRSARTVTASYHDAHVVPRFYGYDHINYIKTQIKSPHCRLHVHELSTKKPSYIQTCSADEGHGILCSEIDVNHERCLHMTHQCCWNLATTHRREAVPQLAARELELVGLAHRTKPIPARTEGRTTTKDMLSFIPLDSVDANRATPLSTLLRGMAKLPQELLDLILVHLGGYVVGALSKTNLTLATMLPRGSSANTAAPGYTRSLLEPSGAVDFLSVGMSNIAGDTYLARIRTGREPEAGDAISIPVMRSTRITGLQIAVPTFGVRALRVLYWGGHTSLWLGDPADCWLGTLHRPQSTTWELRSDVSLWTVS